MQKTSKVDVTEANIPHPQIIWLKINIALFLPNLSDNMPEIIFPATRPLKKITSANTIT